VCVVGRVARRRPSPPPLRIDIVTLEWSQVKQMGKVTNNKCSKDLANERESDRPVNSTHSLTRSPHDVCAAKWILTYTINTTPSTSSSSSSRKIAGWLLVVLILIWNTPVGRSRGNFNKQMSQQFANNGVDHVSISTRFSPRHFPIHTSTHRQVASLHVEVYYKRQVQRLSLQGFCRCVTNGC
jgi:hypothetical protein